ncbi:MAG TPA: DMT family transporter [Anaerolineales bacterium]
MRLSLGMHQRGAGIIAALGSAVLLGFTPVLGKLAIMMGISPLGVVAWRTALAALLILIFVLAFYRQFLYIFPAGLYGCALAGCINGLGSILYYLALQRLDAGIGQMIYSFYPFFVALWLTMDGQPLGLLTFFRMLIAALGILLLTALQPGGAPLAGILMMLGAGALYALHLPINQRVLYEVPAPTVTLYTLLAMSAVVVPAYLIFDPHPSILAATSGPVIGLTIVTSLSRLALFLGVKRIGGMQTALLGLAELLVAVVLSWLWLHESLSSPQWLGALALALSLILVRYEKAVARAQPEHVGWFAWIRPPEIPRDAPWGPHE